MSSISQSFVDEIANACFGHMVSEPELLAQFLGETGTSPDELRSGLNNQLKLGMFEFFAHNESALLAMCANARISAEQFMRAYYRLNPGG